MEGLTPWDFVSTCLPRFLCRYFPKQGGNTVEKFIPYEKLSKKEKRKMDLAKRQTWGELNPVTRKPQNSKAYNRKRTQEWKKELPDLRPFFISR